MVGSPRQRQAQSRYRLFPPTRRRIGAAGGCMESSARTSRSGSADVRDGLSNTILVAEIRSGVTSFDPRGCWAMSGSSSALWACGCVGTDNGPNSTASGGDMIPSCSDVQSAVGGQPALIQRGMSCATGNLSQQTARSMHPGGVNTVFADGSVHFISDSVEVGSPGQATAILAAISTAQQVSAGTITNAPPFTGLGVWDKLLLPSDGFPIPGNAYSAARISFCVVVHPVKIASRSFCGPTGPQFAVSSCRLSTARVCDCAS